MDLADGSREEYTSDAEGLVEIGLNAEGLDEGTDVWVLPL